MSNGYFPEYKGFGDPINGSVYTTTTDTLEYINETGELTTEIPIPEGIDIENKDAIVLFNEDVSTGDTSIIPKEDFLIDYNNDKIILVDPIDVNDKITGKIFSSVDDENLETHKLTDISNITPQNGETLRWDETVDKYVPSKITVRSITDNINKEIDTSGGEVTEIIMDPGIELSPNAEPMIVIDGVPYSNSIIQSIQHDRIILKPENAIQQDAVAEIMILDTKDIDPNSVRNISDWADIDPVNKQIPVWSESNSEYVPGTVNLSFLSDVSLNTVEDKHILISDNSGNFQNVPISDFVNELLQSLNITNPKNGQALVIKGSPGSYTLVNDFVVSGDGPTEDYIETLFPASTPTTQEAFDQIETNNEFIVQSTDGQITNNEPVLIFVDGLLQPKTFGNPVQDPQTSSLFTIPVNIGQNTDLLETSDSLDVYGLYTDQYSITPNVLEYTTSTRVNNILITGTFTATDKYILFVNNAHQSPNSYTPSIIGNDLNILFDDFVIPDIDIVVYQLPEISNSIDIDVLSIAQDQTEFILSNNPTITSYLMVFDGPYVISNNDYYIKTINNKLKITVPLLTETLTVYHFKDAITI